ncbi:MAG: ABC transporter ATP-binding protein [Spirochaetales bacterium]|nr:ABC transporter ATP-binding protein [Spirochaetales bacterium]
MNELLPCCVIEAKNLSFSYDSRKVLEDVNFTIRAGEMVTVVGPNGGGKSTLLKLILGLIEPTSGSLNVMGRDPRDSRSVVGYVPQYAIFDDRFPVTVNEVVLTGRLKKRFGFYGKADRQAAEEAMEQASISDLAGNSFSALSGGQRQRVLIARALAGDPHIILLDEPTANVDAFMSAKFVDLLTDLARKRTVIFVTHDTAYVSGRTDRVFCINRGLHEHPAEDVTHNLINSAYDLPIKNVRHDINLESGVPE